MFLTLVNAETFEGSSEFSVQLDKLSSSSSPKITIKPNHILQSPDSSHRREEKDGGNYETDVVDRLLVWRLVVYSWSHR